MPLFKRSGSDQASTRSVVLRRGSLLAVPGLAEAWQSGWELCWQQISLDALHGFPVWVREVHDALVRASSPLASPAPLPHPHTPTSPPQAAAHPELVLIFSHYCKSLQPSAVAFSLELGVAEFLEFARDVGVTTDAYGQPRVVAAFDAAAKRPAPESLPSRGKQLSYPDFLQLLVTVAFERDNPQYRPAEAAAAAAAAAHGRPSHGGGALPARGVEKALPGCLSSFLDDAVLPKAKRDASFSERDTLTKDEGAQLALQEASTEIEALWSSLKPEGAKGVAMGSFVERLRDGWRGTARCS